MPTNISNALGTARQFTPQPNSPYQERLNGLAAIQRSMSQFTNHELIATNIAKLNAAMQSYKMGNEKRQNEWGLETATRMINSKSAEDIARLDVIDAAQQEGYLDVADNPYFKAHAERLRGEFLSTKARQAYDEKYAQTPAVSADAEVQRWNEFRQQWKQDQVKAVPMNQIAFDKGFNENGLVNQTSLANEYTKKQIEEAKITNYAEVRAQLSGIILDAEEILKTPNLLTEKMQELANSTRMAAIRPDLRYGMFGEAIEGLMKTGKLTEERAFQMMDSVTIQTNADGTRRTLAEVTDPFTVSVMARNYRNQFFTKAKYDFIQKYKNDPNTDRMYSDLKAIEGTEEYNICAPLVSQAISEMNATQKATAKAAQVAAVKADKETDGSIRTRTNYNYWQSHGKKGVDGFGNIAGGTIIGADDKPIDSNTLYKEGYKQIMYALDFSQVPNMSQETRALYVMDAMAFPPYKAVASDIANQFRSELDRLTPDSENVLNPSNNMQMLLKCMSVDSGRFLSVFGEKMFKDVARIKRYAAASGKPSDGFQAYSAEKLIDPETKKTNLAAIQRTIANGYTVEGLSYLASPTTQKLPLAMSGEAMALVEQQALQYTHRMGVDAAIGCAVNDIRDNYNEYHGALIPKTLFASIGSSADDLLGKEAIDEQIYSIADTAQCDPQDVDVRYNPINEMFTISYGGFTTYKTCTQLVEHAREIAKEKQEIPVSSVTYDEIQSKENHWDQFWQIQQQAFTERD